MIVNNPNVDLVNINAFIKFDESSQILSGNDILIEILTSIKAHKSGTNA